MPQLAQYEGPFTPRASTSVVRSARRRP